MTSVRARVWLADGPVADEAVECFAPASALGGALRPSGMGAEAALACFGATAPSPALGPLALAAWDVDAAPRDVGFVLTLASLDVNGAIGAVEPFSDEEARLVAGQLTRLETVRLGLTVGRGTDHALLWHRGSTDLACRDWDDARGRPLASCLPEGDGEPMLRRLIDDSVNLLDGLPFNARRREDGLPPANLLWPWSPGRPFPLQAAPPRLGTACWSVTDGWAHRGAAKVAGFRPASPEDDRPGLTVRVAAWVRRADPEEEAFEAGREVSEGWLRASPGRLSASALLWDGGGCAWPTVPGEPWHGGIARDPDAPKVGLHEWIVSLAGSLSR